MWVNVDKKSLEAAIRLLQHEQNHVISAEPGPLEDLRRALRMCRRSKLEREYLRAAQECHHSDGDLEFDDGAVVSLGDDPGAYVMAWKWVDESDLRR